MDFLFSSSFLHSQNLNYLSKQFFDAFVHFVSDEKCHPCNDCGEVFRSKVALRRHETYVCKNQNAIFSSLNKDFGSQDSSQDLEGYTSGEEEM